MGLVFQLRNVEQLDEAVWKARLAPSDVRFLDQKPESTGSKTILLLSEMPTFDKSAGSLAFNPASARVLVAGSSEIAIVVTAFEANEKTSLSKVRSAAKSVGSGDLSFLEALSPELKEIGSQLLRDVRKEFSGDLRFFPKSGKFIEKPDNFWTIRPQPRDGSLRITVRGRPESFTTPKSLEMKPDMPGYSSFKLSRLAQIEEVVQVLKQVRKK